MKNNRNSIHKLFTLCCIVIMAFCLAIPASAAGDLQSSTLYTGTAQLIADVMLVLTILCPTVCGVAAIVFAIRRSMADEQDGKMWMRRIITAIICGVGGGLISGIISLVASYYA